MEVRSLSPLLLLMMTRALNQGRSCQATRGPRYRTETNPLLGCGMRSVVKAWLSEHAMLLGICLRWTRGDLAEAEDLLGDACLRILETTGSDSGVAHPLAFWATVINNLGRDRSRRKRRWNFDPPGRSAELLGGLPAGSMSAEQQIHLKQCLSATNRDLARLSDRQRTAVLLRSAGIEYSEIGEALSTSSTNARKIVETARSVLRSLWTASAPTGTQCRTSGSRMRPVPSYLVES